ncbi:phosphopantetheine-binding protein [Microbispora sp. NPDC088329]|uniref:acyl carrier protein n=1 Tax=unclassified Microbispora TaxID=2614687 RepID=UPI00342AA0BC
MKTTAPVDERLTQIATMVADLLEATPEEVERATSFADDLSADSFLLIELAARLEQRFGVELGQEDLTRLNDLSATYRVVAEKAGW